MKTEENHLKEVVEKFKVGDRVYINDSLWREANGWCKIMSISTTASEAILERERCNGHALSIPLFVLDKIASFAEYKLEAVGFSQERPRPKKKNGDPFEVGDRVWHMRYNDIIQGVIKEIIEDVEEDFPIRVCHSSEGDRVIYSFTEDGRFFKNNNKVLFHQEPVITFKENE